MNSPEWQYNELMQVGVDYTDVREVEKYDARMQKLRDIDREITRLQEATAPTAASTVLEIGTGTGEFAIAMATVCRQVRATDVSPIMLEYARQKARARGTTNIEFQHAGFLTGEHTDEPFDIIFSQLALHHLPDFWKSVALKNVYNLLKKSGRFFLKDVVYPSGVKDHDAFFAEIIKGFAESVGPEYTKEIIGHIKKEYSTLDWVMENMLTKAGFAIQEAVVDKGFITTYLCTK